MEQQPIVARCIIEMLGAPKEHIVQKLQEHVDKLKEEGLEINTEKYSEPTEQSKLFSVFVELQASFKDVRQLMDFCFDSMPSSVEIMSPEKISLDSTYFEQFINDFQAKLHHTDMMFKNLTVQKQVLDHNAINMMRNFIKYVCAKPHSMEKLSGMLGVRIDELSPFVNGLVESGVLKKEGDEFITNG